MPAIGLVVIGLTGACTRLNPDFDGSLDTGIGEFPSAGGSDFGAEDTDALSSDPQSTGVLDGSSGSDDDSGSETGGGTGGETGGEMLEEDPVLLLRCSLDDVSAVTSPEVGVGYGVVSDRPPILVEGTDGQAFKVVDGGQWFAFPQQVGSDRNVDPSRGRIAFEYRNDVMLPDILPRDLFSLGNNLTFGPGIRLGLAGIDDLNRLSVYMIDDAGQLYLTRFPESLLPVGEWVSVEVAWNAQAEPDEPNVRLWIDGESIEPEPNYPTGPKPMGAASAEEVMVFGSWSPGFGLSALGTFDELEIFDR